MALQIIPKGTLSDWIGQLCEHHRVIAPQRKQTHTVFADLQAVDEVSLDYGITLLPPKKALLPPHEQLFQFGNDGQPVEPLLDDQPTIIFGVHTCDLHAIALLDQVFRRSPADEHYISRRNQTTLVGIESRTSAPVRILRDANGESLTTKGLYPTGEGAGYAGGIMSSAVDGIKVADIIAGRLSA